MQIYYVYILQSTKGRYYTGYTSNLQQRLSQHNRKHKGFTNSPEDEWEVKCYLEFGNKKEAMETEKKLKSFKNAQKAIEYITRRSGVVHPDFFVCCRTPMLSLRTSLRVKQSHNYSKRKAYEIASSPRAGISRTNSH